MTLTQQGRAARAAEAPIVEGLPPFPGIIAAMHLTPTLGVHLCGLAQTLMVEPFPGSTMERSERELIALHVSVRNGCYFCADSHGEFVRHLLLGDGCDDVYSARVVEELKEGWLESQPDMMKVLLKIAEQVAEDPLTLSADLVSRAQDLGATPGDIHLTVLIASAFSMYNRIVDGLRAVTPGDPAAFTEAAQRVVAHGYMPPSATPAHL